MALRVAVVVLSAMLVAGAGCTSKRAVVPATTTSSEPEAPTPAPAPPTTFTTVPGRPRTTVAEPVDLLGGGARIAGTLTGPQGAVAGATVRLERLVGDQVATVDLNGVNGSFSLAGLRGGSYRVRAWKQPDLLVPEPEVFFLAADEQKTVDLKLVAAGAVNVRATVDPSPPPAQDPFTVGVLVFAGTVSRDGVLQATPHANTPVQLVAGAGLALATPGQDRDTTDLNGRASFRVRCAAAGPVSAELLVSTFRLGLALPNCPGG